MNTDKHATLPLYGTIGKDVNGNDFAKELMKLDKVNDNIDIRINSPGGDVYQGMSIVSAILSMKTPVNIYIDGIAASMAAVIAVCGHKVYMQDFAKIMIHDPFFVGGKSMDKRQANALGRIKDMMQRILSRRGKSNEEISRLMSEETWFSAEDAKNNLLCDEVLTSAKAEMLTLAPMQILALVSSEYQKEAEQNADLSTRLIALLGLNPFASEEDVYSAVKQLFDNSGGNDNRIEEALKLGYIDSAQADIFKCAASSDEQRVAAFIDVKRTEDKQKVEALINKAARAGKFIYHERAPFVQIGNTLGSKALEAVLAVLPDRVVFAELLTNKGSADRSKWGLKEYRKYAPQELKDNPKLYAKLLGQEEDTPAASEFDLDYYRRNDPDYLAAHPNEYARLLKQKNDKQ